jgi:hypothetical protein
MMWSPVMGGRVGRQTALVLGDVSMQARCGPSSEAGERWWHAARRRRAPAEKSAAIDPTELIVELTGLCGAKPPFNAPAAMAVPLTRPGAGKATENAAASLSAGFPPAHDRLRMAVRAQDRRTRSPAPTTAHARPPGMATRPRSPAHGHRPPTAHPRPPAHDRLRLPRDSRSGKRVRPVPVALGGRPARCLVPHARAHSCCRGPRARVAKRA